MHRRFACTLLLLCGASAWAQDATHPDFSGTWKLDKERSKLQIPAPDSTIFHLDHQEPRFRLSRTHVVKGESDTFSIELTTDGKEVVVEEPGQILFSRCYWEGDRLVFDSRIVRGEREATNVVRYSLSPDGKTLTAEERFAGPVVKYENTWVFRRE